MQIQSNQDIKLEIWLYFLSIFHLITWNYQLISLHKQNKHLHNLINFMTKMHIFESYSHVFSMYVFINLQNWNFMTKMHIFESWLHVISCVPKILAPNYQIHDKNAYFWVMFTCNFMCSKDFGTNLKFLIKSNNFITLFIIHLNNIYINLLKFLMKFSFSSHFYMIFM